jgi:hypothetical protein
MADAPRIEVPLVPLSSHVGAGDRTGCSTAMLGEFAVVGACDATNEGQAQAGVVHVLRVAAQDGARGATTLVKPPLAAAAARFGHAVAMTTYRGSGMLLVGAPGEGAGYATSVGFIYTFQFSLSQPALSGATSGGLPPSAFAHNYVQRIAAEDAAQDQRFGSAIAVHGERIAVGAPGPLSYPAGRWTIDGGGAVYVFDLNSLDQVCPRPPPMRPGGRRAHAALVTLLWGTTLSSSRCVVAALSPSPCGAVAWQSSPLGRTCACLPHARVSLMRVSLMRVCRVPCAVCRVPCAVCRVPCAMCRVPCAVCRVPCAMCHVPCAVWLTGRQASATRRHRCDTSARVLLVRAHARHHPTLHARTPTTRPCTHARHHPALHARTHATTRPCTHARHHPTLHARAPTIRPCTHARHHPDPVCLYHAHHPALCPCIAVSNPVSHYPLRACTTRARTRRSCPLPSPSLSAIPSPLAPLSHPLASPSHLPRISLASPSHLPRISFASPSHLPLTQVRRQRRLH